MNAPPHADPAPSPWVMRFGAGLQPGCAVLDVACGAGRHARWFAARGMHVTAVDREPVRLPGGIAFVAADIEAGPWPFGGRRFEAVVVTNYLHRPLMPRLLDAVAPGGLLVYETFAAGNERFGRPSRPDFLLAPGELIEAVRGRLTVLAYEHGEVAHPRPAMVQRIAAQAPA